MPVVDCEAVYCRQTRELEDSDDGICEVLKDLRSQASRGTWTEEEAQASIKNHQKEAKVNGCIGLQDIESEKDWLLATAMSVNVGELNLSDR